MPEVRSNERPVALVAEDDYQIRALLVALIEREGFEVVNACNGTEALNICKDHSDLAVLLTDGDLGPGPNGIQIAEFLLKERPSVAILIISGTPAVGTQAAERHLEFLQKPFMIRELSERLKKLMHPFPVQSERRPKNEITGW